MSDTQQHPQQQHPQQQQQQQHEQTSQQAATKSTKTAVKGKSTSKSTATTSKSMPKKAEAVLAAEEIGRMVDLGLGRGIDATNPSPWQMKSSFQVRNCTSINTIGTEEGGALQSYEREVSSVHTQQTDLKASVAVPQAPVNIGIDAEQSRSFSTTRKAVGKKVLNRTISFRADFNDLPQTHTDDPNEAKLASVENLGEGIYHDEERERSSADAQTNLTFEERLSRWIIERILQRESLKLLKLEDEGKPAPPSKLDLKGKSPVSDLANFLQNSSKDERREIVTDCSDFVRHFRITHYVNAIELGAAQYRVFSETEYYNHVSLTGKLGIEALANFVLTETESWRRTKKASDVRQIGVIGSDGRVPRGSYDEAVVGIQIQPISSLLQLRYLQLAMRKALLDYIKVQGDTSVGPYLVACCDDKIFWSVNKDDNFAVEATRNVKNASLFYVIPNDNGDHPYEFTIGYYEDQASQPVSPISVSPLGKTRVEPVARYLSARVNIIGENSGPLHLQYEVQEKHSRLTLLSRLVKGYSPVDTKVWISGRDLFFINCARRTWKKDGYICVKLITGRGQQPRLITACVSSVKSNNERNLWMLFRLLPASYRDNAPLLGEVDELEEEMTAEEEDYEIAFGSDTPEEKPQSRLAVPKPGRSRPHHPTTEDSISRRRELDTSGGTIPPPVGGVDLPELSHPPTSDPTRVRFATTTPL